MIAIANQALGVSQARSPSRVRRWRTPAGANRVEVAKIIDAQRNSGMNVYTPGTLTPAAGMPKWMRSTPALVAYQEQAREGDLLVQQALDGYVVLCDEAGVIIELTLPQGSATRQAFTPDHFENGLLPEKGRAVRLISHLLTAPDLEADATETEVNQLFTVEVTPIDDAISNAGRRFLPR